MRRLVLALLAVVPACGAHVDGNGDDQDNPVGIIDAPISTGLDAPEPMPPDADTSFLTACMGKGYTSATGLTSLYRTAAAATWTAAEAACVADVPGATHLVVLSSQAEVDFIKTKLGWVGLSDRATEGTFVTVTREPNDLRPFLSGQPDNGGGTEDCAQMKAGGLDDDQCNNSHPYVCECDGLPEQP